MPWVTLQALVFDGIRREITRHEQGDKAVLRPRLHDLHRAKGWLVTHESVTFCPTDRDGRRSVRLTGSRDSGQKPDRPADPGGGRRLELLL